MRILIDTANLDDVRWAAAARLIDGVTTNPSLLAEAVGAGDHREHLAALAELVRGPVMAQVMAVNADAMYREGKELARVADNIVVELPMIEEGLTAATRLADDGVRVTMTLVFSAAQALIAAKTGALCVNIFVGRLDDVGSDGLQVVRDVRQLFDVHHMECELVACSIRTPRHFVECARAGADAATVPPSVLRQLLVHPLTDVGLDQFLHDWSHRLAQARGGVP